MRLDTNESEIILEKVEMLGEELKPYFDGLLILGCYRSNDGSTYYQMKRTGNIYAIDGLVNSYLRGEMEVRKETEDEEND